MKCLILTALGLTLAGCAGGGSATPSTTPTPIATPTPTPTPTMTPTPSTGIPRLPTGPHMGIIAGFDDLTGGPYDRQARVDALLDSAQDRGATVYRFQMDWSELEGPERGVYNDTAFDQALANARRRGGYIYMTLSTIDSDGLTLPAFLVDDDQNLNPGLTLASPDAVEAFGDFINWLSGKLQDDDIWGLSLGNEIDSPMASGAVSETDAAVFYEQAINILAENNPDLGVSITFTISAPDIIPSFVERIYPQLDFIAYNHYCLGADLTVTRRNQWIADIDGMKSSAGDREIFIQELGCPVGYGDDGSGAVTRPPNGLMGSPMIQDEYFEYMEELFATDPQFRAATVFQLLDWSPELAEMFGDFVRSEGQQVAGDRLEEWLATIGVCRWADGTCRPAWDTWLNTLDRLKTVRAEADANASSNG